MEDSCTSSIPTVNGVIVDTCTVQTATVMEHNHYVHATIHATIHTMSYWCECLSLTLPVWFGLTPCGFLLSFDSVCVPWISMYCQDGLKQSIIMCFLIPQRGRH